MQSSFTVTKKKVNAIFYMVYHENGWFLIEWLEILEKSGKPGSVANTFQGIPTFIFESFFGSSPDMQGFAR